MRRFGLIFLGMLLSLALSAQTTKVRGQVFDKSTGKPLPFVAVFFVGSQVGTTTDVEGRFSLTTRDMSLITVRAQLLSYEFQDITVKPGIFTSTIFVLRPEENILNAITVKADNSKAKRLLANIDAHREKNNPEMRPGYSCDVYSKLEMDLTHPKEQLKSKTIKKQWNFIFDYVDTSDVSGVPYLPILINETVSRRYHTSNPEAGREEIVATRLSGGDPNGSLLSQFTGSMHLKNNFYSQYINVFNVEIPSPINSNGLVFYNYFIIDSLQIDGRKTYQVRYHPKPSISTPAFDGEMYVDAEEFALKRIKARMVRGQNMNWVQDMQLEASYVRQDDSTWFYKTDRYYADFSVALTDSSKMLSVIGNRLLEFSNPQFDVRKVDVSNNVVSVADSAHLQSEEYWDSARPYELSEKEKNIYGMVEEIQKTKLYKTWYDIAYTVINGYYDVGPIGFGPILKYISFNPLEGFRMRLGMHTSASFSKTDRLTWYLAYGCKDNCFKGGVTWEHLFKKEPTLKLTIDGFYDAVQLGRGTGRFNDGNILSSIFGGGMTQKLCLVTSGTVLLDWEANANFNTQWEMAYKEYHANDYVPMITASGVAVKSVMQGEAFTQLRYSHDETVIRGHFIKTYAHTDYPVVSLNLAGGVSYLNASSPVAEPFDKVLPYFRPELGLQWSVNIPPVGRSRLIARVGTIVGTVPYTLLHIHEGNGTWLLDNTAFSTMKFFEFASDTWVTFMWDHNFKGFFLGKIPWVKKLQLRETATFKMTWGYLSERNNGVRPAGYDPNNPETHYLAADVKAPLMFPEGMRSMGDVPFIEAGFGITNIFRLLRVDFLWRCTHRDDPGTDPVNFIVNFGIELQF